MLKIRQVLLCLLLVVVSVANAQSKKVTGQVTSESDGEPIPGVTIQVKGSDGGAISDTDGNFNINVDGSDAVLIFSFIGMETQEATVGNSNTINIQLASGALQMDEVVVSAMGISREKKSIGYASQTISGEEIADAAVVNPLNALQGKVAGVDISSAPGPGASQNVIIRGASSFSSNQPLYIVDGIPITNSRNSSGSSLNNQVDFGSGVNAINPDDIEDMTILKGAAATAIYGSRAANGVIIVTTKKGTNTDGKLKIAYDGSVSINRVSRIAERQSDFGQGWSSQWYSNENGNWGPKYDDQLRPWGYSVDNAQLVKPYSFVESRIRDFYDLGVNYKNSISAQGGNETTNYFLSFSQNSVDGVNPDDVDTYDRYTISMKGEHKADKLTLSSNFNYSNERTKAVPSGQGTTVFRSLWEVAEDISLVDMKNYNDTYYDLNTYFTNYGVNPYYALYENSAVQKKHKFYGKVQADYDIATGLKATYRFGGDYETSTSETSIAQISIPQDAPSYNDGKLTTGNYGMVAKNRYEYNHDFLLNYTKDVNSKFSIFALAGLNINERGYNAVSGSVSSLDAPGFYNFTNGTSVAEASQYNWQRRLVGLFATAEFSYSDYLFLNVTARNDWSSTLPEDNNSFFYPGATLSFLVSELLDQQGAKPDFLSFGKARVAYGMTGNDAPVYAIDPVFAKGVIGNPGYPDIDNLSFPLNGVNSWMVSNTLGSPDLQPEITKEFEFGFEAGMFENRLGFDFSYYDRYTEGLIQSRPLDPSSGYTSITSNIGDISNKGVELLVYGSPIRTKDFEWKISANYSTNKNMVEELPEGEVFLGGYGGNGIIAKEGYEIGLYKTYVTQTTVIDGEEKIIVDGDGIPLRSTEEEVLTDKSINEKFRAGLTNEFTYKDFTLSATLDLRYGGYMYSYQKDYMQWTGSGYETTLNDRRPFIVPNSVIDNGDGTYSDNTNAVPTSDLHTFYSQGAFDYNEDFLLDKSYLKLREVRLTYALPNSIASKFKMQSIRASVIAGNILLWTPKENCYIDPETTTFGNDISAKFGEYGASPTNQVYTFSLSLTF